MILYSYRSSLSLFPIIIIIHITQNIAKRILISVLNGHSNIDIEAVVENDDDTTSSSNLRSSTRDTTTTTMLHLHTMQSPINSNTIFSFQDNDNSYGQLSDFDNDDLFDTSFLDHTILLAGDDNNDHGTGQTILQVDTLTGTIIGIQHASNGKTNQITINNNKLTREVGNGEGGEGDKGGREAPLKITSMVSNVDRKFHCGADHNHHDHEEEHIHDHEHNEDVTAPFITEDIGQQVISRPGYHSQQDEEGASVASLGKRNLGHHKHDTHEHHTQHSFDDGQHSHDIEQVKKHGGRMEETDHKVHFHTHENMHHHDHDHHERRRESQYRGETTS